MTTTDVPRAGSGARAVDTSGAGSARPTPWAPLKITAAEIRETVERLSEGPTPADGRRSAALVHPESTSGRSFAPGVEVVVEVLLPGERTTPVRRNSSLVQIGLEGTGSIQVGDTTLEPATRDVVTVPSMKPHRFVNTGDRRWVRLAYSNAPLLEFLGTHFREELAEDWVPGVPVDGPIDMEEADDVADRGTAPDHEVSPTGARLRGYEYLVDIEPVPDRALHWPYRAVADLMSQTLGDGRRTIMALYNPATERRQGATGSFFVTLSRIPQGVRQRPEGPGHRHSSVAINYHVEGTGYSVVDGQRIDFGPGDLLLSAPSWREHAHYPSDSGLTVYTVQDHPQHIGMESLIWQEDLGGPILALGLEKGQTGYVAPRNWDDE
ncbi:dioxygenase [Pseudonocardia sp. EC080610-09]|uniref:cupin domain-containing protein n=1 Tax=unclassified Pseudonocardia TaxID=2619320 RepID=UPI00070658D1|nr:MULTISPECIES: cupin domain-containing protein [unclassified Pseudonocardia]ALL77764.1 dioxygenase [Pseudonocardia sp. EC080610-09]ALL80679.1 dioxygenase [Pseudonocardia sp. EC080619-01]